MENEIKKIEFLIHSEDNLYKKLVSEAEKYLKEEEFKQFTLEDMIRSLIVCILRKQFNCMSSYEL